MLTPVKSSSALVNLAAKPAYLTTPCISRSGSRRKSAPSRPTGGCASTTRFGRNRRTWPRRGRRPRRRRSRCCGMW
eukprot:2496454-Pleurochrysis_carterae.AAC.2